MIENKERKYIYRSKTGSIFFHDTSEVMNLNETCQMIFESFQNMKTIDQVSKKLSSYYGIEENQALNDVNNTIFQFDKIGIDLTNMKKQKEWLVSTPIIHVIKNCNSPCIMCDCWKTKSKLFHSAKALEPLFEKLKSEGAQSIMISGGEPLLHPELKEILNSLKRLGLAIQLNTNGILLHNNKWLYSMDIDELIVSMDGVDEDSYRYFRGTNSMQKVLNNLMEFKNKSNRTHIGLRTTLNKYNYNKIDELIEIAKSYLLDGIGFSPADTDSTSFAREDMPDSRKTILSSKLLPKKEVIEQFLRSFVSGNQYYDALHAAYLDGYTSWGPVSIRRCMDFYINVLQSKKQKFSDDPCMFPKFSMVLDYNGDLKNCFYSGAFGNLYDFNNIDWSFSASLLQLKESNKCKTCRGKIFCDTVIYEN